jgi:hypothetical protein
LNFWGFPTVTVTPSCHLCDLPNGRVSCWGCGSAVGWLDAGLFWTVGWPDAGLFWTLGWPDAGLFSTLDWLDAGGFTTGGRFSSGLPSPLDRQAEHSQAISKIGKLIARRFTWRDITYGTAVPILNGAIFERRFTDQSGCAVVDSHAHRVASDSDSQSIETTLGNGKTSGVELFDTSGPGRS